MSVLLMPGTHDIMTMSCSGVTTWACGTGLENEAHTPIYFLRRTIFLALRDHIPIDEVPSFAHRALPLNRFIWLRWTLLDVVGYLTA
jgi:hypothetical protein